MRRTPRPLDRGFSFIELLAYMAIAALLILAAIPQFNAYRQKAVISNLQNDVKNASLDAEAAQITAVRASRSAAQGHSAIRLVAAAGAPDALDALRTAVAKTPRSEGNTLDVALTSDGKGYTITGANPATPFRAVFASSLTKFGSYMLDPGITVVDGNGEPVTSTPTLAAPDAAAAKLCDGTRDAGSASFVGITADGKTVFSPTYNAKKFATSGSCAGTWTAIGNSGASSVSAVTVSDSGRVIAVDAVNKRLLTQNDAGTAWTTVASFPTYGKTPFVSANGDSVLIGATNVNYLVSGINSGSPSQRELALTTPDGDTAPTLLGAGSDLKSLVARSAAGRVYTSSNLGTSWKEVTPAANSAIGYTGAFLGLYGNTSTTVSKNAKVITMMGYTKTDATMVVVQSTDGGDTFAMRKLPENTAAFKNSMIGAGVSQDGKTLVIASTFDATAGVWASTDAGAHWTRIGTDRASGVAMSDDGHTFMLSATDSGTRLGTM